MSKFVTLRTNKENRKNRVVIIAGVELKFDTFGMAEAPERYVPQLIKSGLEVVDDEDVAKYSDLKKEIEENVKSGGNVSTVDIYDQNQKLKLENGKLSNENGILKERITELEKQLLEIPKIEPEKEEEVIENNPEKEEEVREMLKEQTFTEMKEFCEENKLPKGEWKGFKKTDDIREYLVKKLSKID